MSDEMDTDFTANLALSLYQDSKDKNLTDFKIQAGAKTVMVHRSVISANSDYFKVLCKSGLNEAFVDNAVVLERDGQVLDDIVKYMYLGKTTISASNVAPMLVAAEFISLHRLVRLCEEFMNTTLSLTNLLLYHQVAKKIKLQELSAACERLGKDRFDELVSTDWFLSLSMEEVQSYLQADDLQASSEDDVMQALIRWLENCGAGIELRDQYAEILFHCIRLNHCTASKLKDIPRWPNVPNLLKLKILEYLQYGQHQGNRAVRKSYGTGSTAAATPPLTKTISKKTTAKATTTLPAPPEPSVIHTGAKPKTGAKGTKPTTEGTGATSSPAVSVEDHVLLVGGLTIGSKIHCNAVLLDKQPQDSILTSIPQSHDSDLEGISVCAAPGGFIASGGMNTTTGTSTSRVMMFSLVDQSWSILPNMLHSRDRHGSVCINSLFMTVGGCKYKNSRRKKVYASVNVLDLQTLIWAECQALRIAVQEPGVTAVDNDILVIGGDNANSIITNVCRYDSRTGKRTDCQLMPKPCRPYNRTVTVGRFVFVLHYDSNDMFMQYDTRANIWIEIKLPCPIKTAQCSAMVLHNGRIMVTGGI